MQGISVIENAENVSTIEKVYASIYDAKLYDLELMEDMILLTPKRDDVCTNIGTDKIQVSTFQYVVQNILWINVCLFVNEDFRSCFDDAIAIEKALTQVNDIDYQDFRDDMALASNSNAVRQNYTIDFTKYNKQLCDTIIIQMAKNMKSFDTYGMIPVYKELMDEFKIQEIRSIQYILHNMVYVVNAMNWNDVFNKYVRIVVDKVRDQLSE